MSGTFNSNSNPTPVEPSTSAQPPKDIMDAPITPLPVKPLAPQPDDASKPILASSNDGAQDPNNEAFKPQVFRRKSNNYQDAAKRASLGSEDLEALGGQAKSILDPTSSDAIGQLVDTDSKQKGPMSGAGANWQPKFERKQSWDQQEWKHDLQMKVADETKKAGEDAVLGFTETGSRLTKRYSQS